jgi:hypothetical protein
MRYPTAEAEVFKHFGLLLFVYIRAVIFFHDTTGMTSADWQTDWTQNDWLSG